MRIWTSDDCKNATIKHWVGDFIGAIGDIDLEFANLIAQTCDIGFICFGAFPPFRFYRIVLPRDESSLLQLDKKWHSVFDQILEERSYHFTPAQAEVWEKYQEERDAHFRTFMSSVFEAFAQKDDSNSGDCVDDRLNEIQEEMRMKIKSLEPPDAEKEFSSPYERYRTRQNSLGMDFVDLMKLEEFLEKEWHSKVVGVELTRKGDIKIVKIADPSSYFHYDLRVDLAAS